jgi:hypothetical protein
LHTKEEEKRIIEIRKELEREESFFFGADVINNKKLRTHIW